MSLVLFFTRGISLQIWADSGILERETQLYKRLLPHVGNISFVTYGDSRDLAYAKQLDGIRVLCNRWGLPPRLYSRLAPALHARHLIGAGLLKTNQTSGAKAAIPVKQWLGKKLVVRCGFMWSLNAARSYGQGTEAARRVFDQERQAFRYADRVVVTTPSMKEYAVSNHGISPDMISVIPNYVDTDLLSPGPEAERDPRTVCFVGRLVREKNIGVLIDAIARLDARLVVIGDGPLRKELETRAADAGADAHFAGRIPFAEVAAHLRSSAVFALPSLWEGQPKALIEAMACGAAVVVADSPGLRDAVSHGDTGLLCEPTPEGFRKGIAALLENGALRRRLGASGRRYVVREFSLDRVVDLELELYGSLAS